MFRAPEWTASIIAMNFGIDLFFPKKVWLHHLVVIWREYKDTITCSQIGWASFESTMPVPSRYLCHQNTETTSSIYVTTSVTVEENG